MCPMKPVWRSPLLRVVITTPISRSSRCPESVALRQIRSQARTWVLRIIKSRRINLLTISKFDADLQVNTYLNVSLGPSSRMMLFHAAKIHFHPRTSHLSVACGIRTQLREHLPPAVSTHALRVCGEAAVAKILSRRRVTLKQPLPRIEKRSLARTLSLTILRAPAYSSQSKSFQVMAIYRRLTFSQSVFR